MFMPHESAVKITTQPECCNGVGLMRRSSGETPALGDFYDFSMKLTP